MNTKLLLQYKLDVGQTSQALQRHYAESRTDKPLPPIPQRSTPVAKDGLISTAPSSLHCSSSSLGVISGTPAPGEPLARSASGNVDIYSNPSSSPEPVPPLPLSDVSLPPVPRREAPLSPRATMSPMHLRAVLPMVLVPMSLSSSPSNSPHGSTTPLLPLPSDGTPVGTVTPPMPSPKKSVTISEPARTNTPSALDNISAPIAIPASSNSNSISAASTNASSPSPMSGTQSAKNFSADNRAQRDKIYSGETVTGAPSPLPATSQSQKNRVLSPPRSADARSTTEPRGILSPGRALPEKPAGDPPTRSATDAQLKPVVVAAIANNETTRKKAAPVDTAVATAAAADAAAKNAQAVREESERRAKEEKDEVERKGLTDKLAGAERMNVDLRHSLAKMQEDLTMATATVNDLARKLASIEARASAAEIRAATAESRAAAADARAADAEKAVREKDADLASRIDSAVSASAANSQNEAKMKALEEKQKLDAVGKAIKLFKADKDKFLKTEEELRVTQEKLAYLQSLVKRGTMAHPPQP